MRQILIRPKERTKYLKNEFLILITKNQLIKFIILIGVLILNIIAINISSPFLKELFFSQTIILLIIFIKTLNSYTIKK